MEGLYNNRYRIESTRLAGWDYSAAGFYFITICIRNRIECLGEVLIDNDGIASVALSDVGKITRDCWLDIPNHFPNVLLDGWVIMPNHMHGIIVIKDNDVNTFYRDEAMGRDEALPRLYIGEYPQMSKISPKSKSLSVIVGSFKSVVAKTVHKQCSDFHFMWQPRFYDRIIRNETSLQKIRGYIRNNPGLWYRDRNNSEGLIM